MSCRALNDTEVKNCKLCNADIAWVTSTKTGKIYACNVYPSQNEHRTPLAFTHSPHRCEPKRIEEFKTTMGEHYEAHIAPKVRVVKTPVPASNGRVDVVGTVASLNRKEGRYGTTLKMMVECGGYTLYGTVPANLMEDIAEGHKVTFNARVTQSQGDPSFGYFTNPTKATAVAPTGK